jgi:hypothetical protein
VAFGSRRAAAAAAVANVVLEATSAETRASPRGPVRRSAKLATSDAILRIGQQAGHTLVADDDRDIREPIAA